VLVSIGACALECAYYGRLTWLCLCILIFVRPCVGAARADLSLPLCVSLCVCARRCRCAHAPTQTS
jgi:hypothetical protein